MPHIRRLARPIDQLQSHYDVLIVGSGYGAAIAASRFARATQANGEPLRIAILERGKEQHPGEYPDNVLEATAAFQVDSALGHVGSPSALYDFRVNDDLNVFVGCGLGGTSLVNANVALEPDPRVFEDPIWPRELRGQFASLAPYYDRARAMLGSHPLPSNQATPAKLTVLSKMATAIEGHCTRPAINVNFEPAGPNRFGVAQAPCTGCGDCVSGCNVGAKNTLLMNYLPDAANHGAEIFCEVQVRHVAPTADGKWHVFYQLIDTGRDVFNEDTLCVTADKVILGAGTLGSTEILLRSQAAGLALSTRLGHGMTGNGDVLAFGYNVEDRVNGIGIGLNPDLTDSPVGACITGLIDLRNTPDVNDGMVIEEGSLPSAMSTMLPTAFAAAAATLGENPQDDGLMYGARRAMHQAESLLRGSHHGAVNRTQTFLVMSHDGSQGQMKLADDRLRVVWPHVGEHPHFTRVNDTLRRATHAQHGTYVKNPMWSDTFGDQLVTVHPLGGCGMGDDAQHGVVNHLGQVFTGEGNAVYPNLIVCDGAIMPRSLGVNPLITISALAERNIAALAAAQHWHIDYDWTPVTPAPVEPDTLGIRFTETMRGFFSTDITHNSIEGCEVAYTQGKAQNQTLEFTLTIQTEDLTSMLAAPTHPAQLIGTVVAPQLSSQPLTTSEGKFQLLSLDSQAVETRNMVYDMVLSSVEGERYHFHGIKIIHDNAGFDMWADTTTLYVTLRAGGTPEGAIVGVGILHIRPADFLKQMTTLTVLRAPNLKARLTAMAQFGRFFAGKLADTYGGVLTHYPLGEHDNSASLRKKRLIRVGEPEIYPVKTDDGVMIRLTRYQGGTKGPVMLSHGMGVSSGIYTLDTIDTNLTEYLYAHGYDVWLLDYRASILLPSSLTQFSADEVAQYDYPAAVAKIQAITGRAYIQIMGHCMGAAALFMSIAQGLQGVRSALFSQVAGHVDAPLFNKVRAGLHLPDALDLLGVDSLNAYVNEHPNWLDRLYDLALEFNPGVPHTQHCNSPACHRISFIYALLYEHAQLNNLTHETLGEWFGVANIRTMEHLANMVRHHKVIAANGDDRYLPDAPAARAAVLARFDLPIGFIHGGANACYLPSSTARTEQMLRDAHPKRPYTRVVIEGYGHIDCIFGKNAVRDVYPHILAHLDAYQ